MRLRISRLFADQEDEFQECHPILCPTWWAHAPDLFPRLSHRSRVGQTLVLDCRRKNEDRRLLMWSAPPSWVLNLMQTGKSNSEFGLQII